MRRKQSDAVELINEWYRGDPEWDTLVAEEELNMQIGQILYDVRQRIGLSQVELARQAGTTQAIISKIENADYTGNAIEVLKRACFALHIRIQISCVPPAGAKDRPQTALGV